MPVEDFQEATLCAPQWSSVDYSWVLGHAHGHLQFWVVTNESRFGCEWLCQAEKKQAVFVSLTLKENMISFRLETLEAGLQSQAQKNESSARVLLFW